MGKVFVDEEQLAFWEVFVPPEQFFDLRDYPVEVERECALLVALLENAIGDFQKYMFARTAYGKRLFASAKEWFTDGNHRAYIAFEDVCQYLGLDFEYIRMRLLLYEGRMRAEFEKRMSECPHTAGKEKRTIRPKSRATISNPFYKRRPRYGQSREARRIIEAPA